ncbi:MAG: GTP 3',8-cyclase MoaA [Erysipelotrichaceae bacterium]|nr:GTP 3',8-cyclase MoaA [Erysipelotrichaceae bacterium]
MKDSLNREIDYMRISITDRCNLRCQYCMPQGIKQTMMSDILTFEEMAHIVSIGAKLGIKKIKVTGGEPLVRLGCCDFIKMLKNIEGIEQVTITTNGVLLDRYMDDLITAGVDSINVSIDTLNRELYQKLTGFDKLDEVLQSLKILTNYDIPVKINAVSIDLHEYGMRYGIDVLKTDYQNLIELAHYNKIDVRFIEMMPIGYGKNFETINHQDFLQQLKKDYVLQEDSTIHGNGPAVYYKIDGYEGSIGLISAIHGKFCDSCNRIRLTSQGYLKTCLCFNDGVDLRTILRSGAHNRDELLEEAIKKAIVHKPNAHRFENKEDISEDKNMYMIGG